MDELLKKMLERRSSSPSTQSEEPMAGSSEPTDDLPWYLDPNDPAPDVFCEQLAWHLSRVNKPDKAPKVKASKPERAVLAAIKRWMAKIPNMDTKRVSVGKMRTKSGFMMNFGGKVGESDLIITPHKGQPFERQIHVEVKRPDVIIDGKKVQRAGKQSDNQVKYQAEMEARGDSYVVVTSVAELRIFLESLGFTDLPKIPKGR